jgi:hypothetical protein
MHPEITASRPRRSHSDSMLCRGVIPQVLATDPVCRSMAHVLAAAIRGGARLWTVFSLTNPIKSIALAAAVKGVTPYWRIMPINT